MSFCKSNAILDAMVQLVGWYFSRFTFCTEANAHCTQSFHCRNDNFRCNQWQKLHFSICIQYQGLPVLLLASRIHLIIHMNTLQALLSGDFYPLFAVLFLSQADQWMPMKVHNSASLLCQNHFEIYRSITVRPVKHITEWTNSLIQMLCIW